MNKAIAFSSIIVFLLIMTGCAQLKKHAEMIKPTAKIANVRLDGINFEEAFLIFDIKVDNPNPVSLELTSLAYEMKIEDQSLISGVTAKGLRLKSKGQSRVEVPVTLKFDDLKKLPGSLWGKDEVEYRFNTTITLNLPVIGNYDIRLENKGQIPVPKLPDVTLKTVKLNKLDLTSAEILTTIEVNNPNPFSLGLKNINYTLDINNQTWGQGNIAQKQNVPGNGIGTIGIPVKLNLLNMGRAVYQLLTDKETVDYQLRGGLELDTGIALLKNFKMPLDIKGKTALR